MSQIQKKTDISGHSKIRSPVRRLKFKWIMSQNIKFEKKTLVTLTLTPNANPIPNLRGRTAD